MRNIYCILFLISIFTSLKAQKQIRFSQLELKKSFLEIKKSTDLNRAAIEYDFIGEHYYNSIFSTAIINDIKQVASLIELPFDVENLERIRMIECYYSTDSYSIWYITLTAKNSDKNYYYLYENNSGITQIPLATHNKGEDYIWKSANMLSKNRSEKNNDYMILAEIENNLFTTLKATQTFHISDDNFLRIILQLLKEKK